jgi:uncharacterized protein (DUF2252 family)
MTAPAQARPKQPGVPAANGADPDERAAAGKAARAECPRSAHGGWEPLPDRRSPVEILAEQDATRVADLVPVRYGRMLDSPFTFYRGAAAIMAADLGVLPATGLNAQLCGDAHLSNFGGFMAPDRRLVFDINDFDETLPGPFEWDVKRLAASFSIGGRAREFEQDEYLAAVLAATRSYREAMRGFAAMRNLDIWYARVDIEETFERYRDTVSKSERKRARKLTAKARNKDSLRALARLTDRSDGKLRIASRPPVLVPIEEFAEGHSAAEVTARLEALLAEYRTTLDSENRRLVERYHYVDAGFKVVGVGSVGTRAWIALLLGRDDRDPLFLQVKEAGPSVLEPFAGASRYRQHGHRVVAGQRLMQAAGDVLLGWLTAEGLDGVTRDFYVRQLWDGKGSVDVDAMSPDAFEIYAQLCGWTLARAHARSGDPVAIAAYLGKGKSFDRAIADFAEDYADQNEADYAEVRKAVDDGRIEVQTGV